MVPEKGPKPELGYQTQYTDPTTGDVLAQSRWYSPGTGTFRSRDTYAGDLNTPVSLNRYTYAGNNPIRYWDPTGRLPCQNPDSCLQEVDQLEKNYAAGTGTGAVGTGLVGISGNPVTIFCPAYATSCGTVTSSTNTETQVTTASETASSAQSGQEATAGLGAPPSVLTYSTSGGSCAHEGTLVTGNHDVQAGCFSGVHLDTRGGVSSSCIRSQGAPMATQNNARGRCQGPESAAQIQAVMARDDLSYAPRFDTFLQWEVRIPSPNNPRPNAMGSKRVDYMFWDGDEWVLFEFKVSPSAGQALRISADAQAQARSYELALESMGVPARLGQPQEVGAGAFMYGEQPYIFVPSVTGVVLVTPVPNFKPTPWRVPIPTVDPYFVAAAIGIGAASIFLQGPGGDFSGGLLRSPS